jgi:hypothetical protein
MADTSQLEVLHPCPTCGRRFDFQLTGCVTFVVEGLLAHSKGNCPDCGTLVVVERSGSDVLQSDPLSLAGTLAEKRAVLVIDLPLSVRCRNTLNKLGIKTVAHLLSRPYEEIRDSFTDSPQRLDELNEMCLAHDLHWSSR